MRGPATCGLLLCLIVGVAEPAAAQSVRRRLVLPPDGMPVDIAPLALTADEPMRVVISGTLSSSLDGSEIDALERRVGDRLIEAEGPFVLLPNGTRLVEADREIHRYVFEIPRSAHMPVAVHLAPLAVRHLVTLSELERSCTGALELEVLGEPTRPPMSSRLVGKRAATSSRPLWQVCVPAGGGTLAILFALGLVVWRRRRAPAERSLIRRCEAANRAIAREVKGLGPAFDSVAEAGGRLLESAVRMRSHLDETRGALSRTGHLRAEGARMARAQLRTQECRTLACLQGIAERLEATAADLAARQAGRSRVRDLDQVIAALDQELAIVDEAVREAELSS